MGCLIVSLIILLWVFIFTKAILLEIKPYLIAIKELISQQSESVKEKAQFKELLKYLENFSNIEGPKP